jgi:peptidylprolyl isomerase domain and WD repeat-containing protein 1
MINHSNVVDVITASMDGIVKFWKKEPEGIDFVKRFRAHLGKSLSFSGPL